MLFVFGLHLIHYQKEIYSFHIMFHYLMSSLLLATSDSIRAAHSDLVFWHFTRTIRLYTQNPVKISTNRDIRHWMVLIKSAEYHLLNMH